MKNKPLIIAGAICAVCVAVMIAALVWSGGREAKQAEFTPPPFDASAQAGMPEAPQALGWSEISQDGMGFSVFVSGKPMVQNGGLTVYFTNPAENAVWLKLRVLDAADKVMGESGLIKPGAFVQSIPLDHLPANGARVKLKIMAYEPETYYSAGAVGLNTTITVE